MSISMWRHCFPVAFHCISITESCYMSAVRFAESEKNDSRHCGEENATSDTTPPPPPREKASNSPPTHYLCRPQSLILSLLHIAHMLQGSLCAAFQMYLCKWRRVRRTRIYEDICITQNLPETSQQIH